MDSFIGSLIGQCVGDALGFIVEGRDTSTCQDFISRFMTQPSTPHWQRCKEYIFGQYSDDSQLARETYVAFVQNKGKLDPMVYSLRIALFFQPGNYRIVGYGYTTAKAGEALWMGQHYESTGNKETTGNGSAMRSAPIGLLTHKWPIKDVIQITLELSKITHASESCMNGSVAIALATRFAMASKNKTFDGNLYLKSIASHMTLSHYATEMRNIITLLKENTSDYIVLEHIKAYGISHGEPQWNGISVGVLQSTLWALYSFCKYPDNYVHCISNAIACGGDVDTTAAMAGTLSGARLGLSSIPSVWAEAIHDIDSWTYKDLRHLVERAYEYI